MEDNLHKDSSFVDLFSESLGQNKVEPIEELVNNALEVVPEEDLLECVPLVAKLYKIYKTGCGIRERMGIKKLAAFLCEFNKGLTDEEKLQKYREKLKNNEKFRNQELEYILVLIDRYIGTEKPEILAKLYWAYLNGGLDMTAFTQYAEVIDRFLPEDKERLLSELSGKKHYTKIDSSILRLVALGLMIEKESDFVSHSGVIAMMEAKKKEYILTDFGKKLVEILK